MEKQGHKKAFFLIDCETTGLDLHHEIIEFAMVRFDCNFNILGDCRILINAEHDPKTFSKKAFEKNGFDPEKISSHGVSRQEAGEIIRRTVNIGYKVIPVGHYISEFDIPKIKTFLMPEFDIFFDKRKMIDTKFVANFFNINDRFKSTSLLELAELFGISTEGAHSALPDCYRNLEVLKKFYSSIS